MGVFHISFKDRLQELIIAKTKKKIGPEYEDDEEEAGEQAITAPDGLEGTGKQSNEAFPSSVSFSIPIVLLGCLTVLQLTLNYVGMQHIIALMQKLLTF